MKPEKKTKWALFVGEAIPRIYTNKRPEPGQGKVIEITESDERRLEGHPPHTWYLHEGEIQVRPERKPRPVIKLQTRSPSPEAVELKPPAPLVYPSFWQKNKVAVIGTLLAIGVSIAVRLL